MKPAARGFLVSASQSGASNGLSLLVSLATTLIFPKLLGVEPYSFWQLYVFYVGYVGVLQFGWNDGIYLRYGGSRYESLDGNRFARQFWMLACSQLVIGGLVVAVSWATIADPDRSFILAMTGVATVILGARWFFIFLWQATNLIGRYARVLALESAVFIVAASVAFLSGNTGFRELVICDLVAKGVSLAAAVYWCRGLVFRPFRVGRADLVEAWQNVSVGIKLMLANLASILMVGVVRFAIERHWDVVTFGKVSLALSMSSLVMVFVNAVGVVVFPTLRRIDASHKAKLFRSLRTLYLAVAALLLFLYFPLQVVLGVWLPDYADSLRYLGLLFPVFVFEGRMALLVNSFLKDLRQERSMLVVNVGGVALAAVLALAATSTNNLALSVASILVLVVARATAAELVLWRRLRTRVGLSLVSELLLTAVFAGSTWFLPPTTAVVAYAVAFVAYLAVSAGSLRRAGRYVRGLIR